MLNMWRSLARDGGSGGDIMMPVGLKKKNENVAGTTFFLFGA